RTTRQRVVVALNATTIHRTQERRDGAQRLRRTAPARAPHRVWTNEDAARVDGERRDVGVEGFVVAVLKQILFDVRDVERADGGVAVPEVRGDGPNGLRSAEVAGHRHDQVFLMEHLDVLIVVFRRQEAARLAGRVGGEAGEIGEVAA